MTAMSALRATPEPVPPTSPSALAPASGVQVVIPGTDRTYENREVLRGMGLRWDPPTHAWHGTLSVRERELLRERFHVAVRPVVPLEAFPAPTPAVPDLPTRPHGPSLGVGTPPACRPPTRDYSRTRAESRIAIRDTADELADPWEAIQGGRFSLLDITSGLPDDSRDSDERAGARHLADLRGRVKAARAVVSQNPEMAKAIQRDWRKASWFYASWGITEEQFRKGVPYLRETSSLSSAGPLPSNNCHDDRSCHQGQCQAPEGPGHPVDG